MIYHRGRDCFDVVAMGIRCEYIWREFSQHVQAHRRTSCTSPSLSLSLCLFSLSLDLFLVYSSGPAIEYQISEISDFSDLIDVLVNSSFFTTGVGTLMQWIIEFQ